MNLKKFLVTGLLATTILVVTSKESNAASYFDEKYYTETAPSGYYKRVDLTAEPEEIKYTLGEIISANYVQHSYKDNNTVLKYTDPDPSGSGKAICIYSGRKLDSGSWNKEHVWAKSHGFPNSSSAPYCDAHHLRPSTVSINSTRSNKDFGEIPNATPDAYGNKSNNDLFEPRDEVKGDIARMMFYMETRYGQNTSFGLKLVNDSTTSTSESSGRFGNLQTLIKWHYQDPVSKEEIYRNNVIFDNYQHNRNPYIDHPEYVDYVYPSKYAGTTPTPTPTPEPDPTPEPTPTPEPSNGLEDYNFVKIEKVSDITEGVYLIGGGSNYMVSEFIKDGVFNYSNTPTEVFTLEKKGNLWALKNKDSKYLSINAKTNSTFSSTGSSLEIEAISGGFVFKANNFVFSYNTSSPRFTSYGASQGALILYKGSLKQDVTVDFENLEIKCQLAYHWATEDGKNYTIDNSIIRFGVQLTEELKQLGNVKFGAFVCKASYLEDIDLKEYIGLTEATTAEGVENADNNVKHLEFKNIAAKGGMTSVVIDVETKDYNTELAVVIYMEYNGKLYLTSSKNSSFKAIATEYLSLNNELSDDQKNTLTQIING